jgi:hypothetical protein
MNTTTGNVGIQSLDPINKLQIGAGLPGFKDNDLVIGNGVNALAIYQSNVGTYFTSTTDMIFMPRNNSQGKVGINTNTPRAPLDVFDNVTVPNLNQQVAFAYYALGSSNTFQNISLAGVVDFAQTVPNVTIYAESRVLASEFNAYSDARIKNIAGISNTANDLQTINALQITDYTMKDIVKYGIKPFKKVIAQEVEKVYPQVITKHADFIPNVYQLTDKVTQTNNGCLLHFASKHTISGTAKKLRVLLDETVGMQELNIIAIPSANEVVIEAKEIKSGKVFVYGEEVADFRTVDYEGLSTLNISATQELSKLEKQQQQQIEILEKRLAAVEAKLSITK